MQQSGSAISCTLTSDALLFAIAQQLAKAWLIKLLQPALATAFGREGVVVLRLNL